MNHLWIFTLNWNGATKLTTLKESLMPSLATINYTWLIKDNSSKDNSLETIKNWQNDNIKCLAYKSNQQNFSAGMNLLFAEASPQDNDLILLLNNDVIFKDRSSIKNMINLLQKNDQVGVVGARLLYPETNRLQHAGVVFDEELLAPTHFREGEKADENSKKNRLFQVVTGAMLLTKAEYYKNIHNNKSGTQGMDENYHWAFDDVDLCLSIKYNLNKEILYYGQSNIVHEGSASLKKNPVNKLFMPHNLNYLRDKWKDRYIIDRPLYRKNIDYNIYEA